MLLAPSLSPVLTSMHHSLNAEFILSSPACPPQPAAYLQDEMSPQPKAYLQDEMSPQPMAYLQDKISPQPVAYLQDEMSICNTPIKRPPIFHEEESWGEPPKRRLRAKPDGRCQVRAVLHACCHDLPPGVSSILTDDSRDARSFICKIRADAAIKLREATEEDETLQMIIAASFPDERYDSFEEWVEYMGSDDTEERTSTLWHGGGQWLLYGLGILLSVTIEVTSLYPLPYDVGSGFMQGGSQDVVAAGDRRVHLAMLHDDEGIPDHFDVLEPAETISGAEDAPSPVATSDAVSAGATADEAPDSLTVDTGRAITDAPMADGETAAELVVDSNHAAVVGAVVRCFLESALGSAAGPDSDLPIEDVSASPARWRGEVANATVACPQQSVDDEGTGLLMVAAAVEADEVCQVGDAQAAVPSSTWRDWAFGLMCRADSAT